MKFSKFFLSTIVVIFSLFLLFACKQKNKNDLNALGTQRDKSITPDISHNQIFFDSTRMENFISTQKFHDSLVKRLRSFYNGRNYQFAWFFEEGMAEYAGSFYETYNDYLSYSGDSSLFSAQLKTNYDSLTGENFTFNKDDDLVFKTEILLTAQFFRYARRAYMGSNQIDARELEWFIPRKKINPAELLDTLLVHKGKNFTAYEPVNRQYNLLKDYLLKYYEIDKAGGWKQISLNKKILKAGDTSSLVPAIKHRLFLTGDLQKDDTSSLFDPSMEMAVKNFEHRYGFKEDGKITAALMNELNRPVKERLEQILINMERIRWMPAQPESDYLLVNIPEFKLHVYEKGKQVYEMNVVVIFTGNLKYVVFSPYWNVPKSILVKEVQPGIRRNKNYLNRNHMEWYDGAVRQKPGPWNSLGQVKFLFPNNFNIYLHDTPSKNLFEEEKRTFSHGCIRIAEPKWLAQFLLRNDPAWDSLKIVNAMNAGKEQYVTIKEKVPVFIGYFTAWVGRDGQLNFRDDIYGHDKKMKAHLFAGNK
jgi:murein L,D-transpeptidase YcbB/YkuD